MFLYDIKQYVKVYLNFIPRESCKIIIDRINEDKWIEHNYSSLDTNIRAKNKKEFLMTEASFQGIEELNRGIAWMIDKYVLEHLNYPWYNKWQNFHNVRFNKYTEGTFMSVHCDHITTLFDGNRKGIPTLTVLGTLNDDFEGGDFLMWDNEKIELPAGSLIIFPSNFMFPHSVTPVTKGTRYSYVTWVW